MDESIVKSVRTLREEAEKLRQEAIERGDGRVLELAQYLKDISDILSKHIDLLKKLEEAKSDG